MKIRLSLLLALLLPAMACAQQAVGTVWYLDGSQPASPASGTLVFSVGGQLKSINSSGTVVTFGSGGSGGLTSFTVGNLSPLFTASLGANPTTTPALAFTASTAAQNAVLAGPSTGGTGAYRFRSLVAADIPTITATQASLGNVTNAAQTLASVMPNTAPAAGRLPIGNAGGTAYAPLAVSGDSTLSSAGLMTNTGLNGTLLSGLATGLLKVTTATGAITVGTAGTDYSTPAATETLTNKTINFAVGGNVLEINGTTISSVTGTGSVNVMSVAPAITGTATFAAPPTFTSLTTAGLITNAVTTGALSSVVGSSGMATLGPLLGSGWSSSASLFLNATGAWSSGGGGFSNPMTSVGDLIVGGTSGTAGRLGISATANTVFQSTGTTGAWSTGTLNLNGKAIIFAGGSVTFTTSGNVITFTMPSITDTIAGWNTVNLFAPTLRTTGAAAYFTLNTPADTGITAATEGPGAVFGNGATRTWATTGTVTLQREFKFAAPTYASASASQTFTTAATVDITGAPVAGTNAIITNAYALNVEAGAVRIAGILNTGSDAVINTVTVGLGGGAQTGNVLVGTGGSLLSNTLGVDNTVLGYQASAASTTGQQNVAIGADAIKNLVSSSGNVGIGFAALFQLNASNAGGAGNNVGIGFQAGQTEQNIGNCTFLGYNADCTTSGVTNSTALGAGATVTATNQMVFGNGSITANVFTGSISLGQSLSFGSASGASIGGGAPGTAMTINGPSGGLILQTTGTTGLTMDSSQNLQLAKKITSYNGVTASGWGIPAIYGTNSRVVGVVNAASAAIYTYTVGAADGTFEVDGNVLVTAVTAASLTMTCTYTDEGNTSRTLTLTFSQVTGTLLTAITNVTGVGAYEGVPLHIRCKASTSITFAVVGTATGITYNAEGLVKQEG